MILDATEAVIVHAGVRKELKLVSLDKSFQKFTMVKALWFISVDVASMYIITYVLRVKLSFDFPQIVPFEEDKEGQVSRLVLDRKGDAQE